MTGFKTILTVVFIFTLTMAPVANAQDAGGGGGGGSLVQDTMEDLFTVVGAGAGGAILGLSTLSFSSEPSRHLRNIVVGAAIGIIAGVFVVAYRQAGKSQEFLTAKELSTHERLSWHKQKSSQLVSLSDSAVGWSVEF